MQPWYHPLLLPAAAGLLAGCGRAPLPTNPTPARDRAELEARYETLRTGVTEPEAAGFLGKAGPGWRGTRPSR